MLTLALVAVPTTMSDGDVPHAPLRSTRLLLLMWLLLLLLLLLLLPLLLSVLRGWFRVERRQTPAVHRRPARYRRHRQQRG